jgi:hypothetical protein
MPYERFVSVYQTGPLGYLISTRKALRILLAHRIRDARFQRLLVQWTGTLLTLIAVVVCAFFLVPAFWAVSAFAPGMCLFALFISLEAGDLFLKLALEDKRFFEMATQSNALLIFEDDDQSLPQPGW